IRGILGNIGDTYREQGNVAKALEYHYKALEVAKLTGSVSKVQMSFEYYRLAKDYFVAGNYANADHLLKKFLSVTKVSDFDIMGWLSDAKSMQVHIDSLTGNYKDAFQHYKEYILIREKQKSEDARKAAIREKYKNEYEEQKARDKSEQDKRDAIAASELQQQKFSRNAYAIGAILLLIISGILYNRNRLKHRNYIQLHEKNKIITEEKKRSDDLLLNILPMEVAEELKQTGGSVARQYNNVTVIFTDFVNFTSISQHLTPVELVEEIHRNFTAFDHIIEQHGLEKIKTIGDAYLAVCGLPIEKSDHALRAIQAAIEIRNYIAHQDTLFQIRIGVHSGNVVAGIVGVKKYAYDIWGDTVNTANRLESHSEAGKINISSSTYELIKNQYRCTYRGKVEAKGKGEIDMYYVEGKLEKTILSA
ncbi:MAG TPA: adenylate/guanylate cyclase domain-containing protein, partial [Chitinophagaceae bacterium]|nr:adenylate/guanylate cyclase domain-containing protein [Chitinophagaceae bacterium]